ncbi:protein S-acyltransferase 10-like isoform X2 [Durio zibethinus]|uniref:S-acyltransferase n=1 Tax=Durio zibethinus TaxID=66656 RepID=A0A6P6BEE7_DURZI|nr:protein S-acyltransferase 10-like isoform X2 [Durio zibethinus]
MTMIVAMCRTFRDRALDRCFHCFPCLSDPAWRSSLGLKVALVMLHLIYAGILFLFDSDLIEKTKKEPWYTALYLLLFFATLVQYFITSGSSPGYVLDAMRAVNETNVMYKKSSTASKQPASSKNGSLIVTIEGSQTGRNFQGSNPASWTKLVMDMYPPGTSIRAFSCFYCNVEQPPRAKHCHDCDKCVLQFDHHCVWLGTCIGQGNHCKFWWYICEETALCLWTGILYITYLKANISRAWWKDAIMILLLIAMAISIIFLLLLLLFHSYLVLTNQTTYELVRRRRIPYLSIYHLESLPSAQELEEKSRPYTCLDVLTCRCC